MDAPAAKIETTKIAPPETPEQQARAREALRQFTNFAPRAEDFQGRDLESSQGSSNGSSPTR